MCKEGSCGCCPIGSAENDPEHPYNKPYVHGEDQGITRRRSCTDVICLFLFFVFLGVWGFVAFMGFRQGNIDKVNYSMTICFTVSSLHFINMIKS